MTKTKNSKPTDMQKILGALDLIEVRLQRLEKQPAQVIKEVPIERKSDQELLNFLRPLFNEAPKPKPLKWYVLFTFEPEWYIAFDPYKSYGLVAGAPVELVGLLGLAFEGLCFGSIPKEHYSELKSRRENGAKFYAFMRSDRRITIKVGYPQ